MSKIGFYRFHAVRVHILRGRDSKSLFERALQMRSAYVESFSERGKVQALGVVLLNVAARIANQLQQRRRAWFLRPAAAASTETGLLGRAGAREKNDLQAGRPARWASRPAVDTRRPHGIYETSV